ncbi:MAG: hypothetical protein GYB36_00905 [Alphaproteobacteria bacterium]|nr:hypothetical protein [Alphaproteobacteria bacterium]
MTLKLLNSIGLGLIARFVITLTRHFGASSEQTTSLANRVFGKFAAPLINRSTFVVLHAAQPSRSGDADSQNNIGKLSKFETVHVFLESGAQAPEFLNDRRFQDTFFKFYSFGDISAQIDALGLNERSSSAPLRDQFNEISTTGTRLFNFSDELSSLAIKTVSTQYCNELRAISSRLTEAASTALFDRISARLSLIFCFKEALKQPPKNEGILLIGNTPQYFPEVWNFLSEDLSKSNTFVGLAHKDQIQISNFATEMSASIRGDARDNRKTINRADEIRFQGTYSKTLERATAFAVGSAKGIARRLGGIDYTLVVHADSAAAYKETLRLIGRDLIEAHRSENGDLPIFLHASLSPESEVTPELMKYGRDTEAASISLSRLGRSMNVDPVDSSRCEDIAWQLGRDHNDSFRFENIDTFPIVRDTIARFLQKQLPLSIASHSYSSELAKLAPPRTVIASTSRQWMTRAICAGLLDGAEDRYGAEDRLPIIDVQSLNILRHPKYKAPVATHATVIDTAARDIYSNYLGFDEKKVILTGAPQNDNVRLEAELVDGKSLREQLGVRADERTVLLISQLQPMSRMAMLVEPLANMMENSPNTRLIIRLHPRETTDRESSYRRLLGRQNLADRVIFSRTESPVSILSIADACVTIYSNMAREAALLSKPVIVPRYLDWEPPIQLDKEGIAAGADSPEQLQTLVDKAITPHLRAEVTEKQTYFLKNAHVQTCSATSKITELVQALAGSSSDSTQIASAESRPARSRLRRTFKPRHTLLVARDTLLSDLPPLYRSKDDLTVYTSDKTQARGFLPGNAIIESGEFTADTAGDFEAGVLTANTLAERLIDILSRHFEGLPETSRILTECRHAIWLRTRPQLIREVQSIELLRAGIRRSGNGPLTIACTDDETRNFLCRLAAEIRGSSHGIRTLLPLEDASWETVGLAEYLKSPTLDESPPATTVSTRKLLEARGALEHWTKNFETPKISTGAKARVLATTAWNLKTVPPTLLPVLKQSLAEGVHVTAVDINDASTGALKVDLLSCENGKSLSDTVSLTKLRSTVSEAPPKALKTLSQFVRHDFFQSVEHTQLAPPVKNAALQILSTIVRNWLPETFIWHRYCDEWFSQPRGVSLACPGRQWHADIAHKTAEAHGRLSITLQNAYMTGGYTYTAPTGQYLTAIDEWSKRVFIEHFDADPTKVHVMSTPRFDYLKDLRKLDRNQARVELGFNAEEVIVLFAAQVGFDAEATVISRALADVETADGRPVRHIVKLHPRTSTEEVHRLRDICDDANPNHRVSVVADEKIQEYLAASDIVITIFSNVGTEAAVLGRKLIIAKFTETPLPVPMDEFGFAYVARTPEDMKNAIERYMSDELFIREQARNQERYRQDNPAMVDGTSLEKLTEVIKDGMRQNWSPSREVEIKDPEAAHS